MLPETPPVTTLASVWRRFGARCFDNLLVGIVWLIPMAITGHVNADTLSQQTWLSYAIWATAVAYEIVLVAQTGQTIGKRLLSIQVVDAATGAIPTLDQSARRSVPTVIQVLPFLDLLGPLLYVPVLWRPRRQGLHDQLAHTVVIDLRIPGAAGDYPSS